MPDTETHTKIHGLNLLLATGLILLASQLAGAQDLLRRIPSQHQSQPQQSIQSLDRNSLANIQLPPQLSSLTPQQLHHLAQLRELQIQQQAAQQQQQSGSASAPPPIGAEQLNAGPTAPPTGALNGQIPQPAARDSGPTQDSGERHDDGSYNEAGTEMEGAGPSTESQASSASPAASSPTAPQAAPTFEVNWNKCPQLEPSEAEKNKKTQVITKCLQSAPIPQNLTRENVEAHREQIASCALSVEGWFDEGGNYKYDKAELEIRAKKLEPSIEVQVLKFHVACKEESSKKFPRSDNKLIDQVQFYQACMDYYISIVCEIEVSVDQ